MSTPGLVMATLRARMVRAGRLDQGLYRELQGDGAATVQAVVVVALGMVSLWLGGIGLAFTRGYDLRDQALALVWIVPSVLLGWIVWALLAYALGGGLLRGKARLGALLRALGFANAPGVFYILVLLPGAGALINLAILIWIWVAALVALRATLGTSAFGALWLSLAGGIASLIVRDLLRP